jgi:two-component system, NtrC family, response regulator HydG
VQTLERTGWNKAKAARLLGMSRRTIYRKIEAYGVAVAHQVSCPGCASCA